MNTPETYEQWRKHVRQHLRTTFQASPASADHLLTVAEATLRQGVHNLTCALCSQKAGPSLAKTAHFLKGALANMGLEALADRAGHMETLAATQPEEAARQAEELLRALCALLPPSNGEAA